MKQPSDPNFDDTSDNSLPRREILFWGAILPSAIAILAFLVSGWVIQNGTTYASLGHVGLVIASVLSLVVLPLLNLWLLVLQPKSRSRAFFLGLLIPGILATVTIFAMWNDRYGSREQPAEAVADVVESISQP